jgi:hypothetical protein
MTVVPGMPSAVMAMEVVESAVVAPTTGQEYRDQYRRNNVSDIHDHAPYATHSLGMRDGAMMLVDRVFCSDLDHRRRMNFAGFRATR